MLRILHLCRCLSHRSFRWDSFLRRWGRVRHLGNLGRQLELLPILGINWLEQSLRQLSPQFLNLKLIHSVLTISLFNLSCETVQLHLQRLNMTFLLRYLLLELRFLREFLDFSVLQLLVQSFQVRSGIAGLLCAFRFDILSSLFLFFNLILHFAAFFFQHHELLMLDLHRFFVFSLFKLKFAKVFLRDSELLVQLRYLDVIFTFFIQSLERFLLLSLHFEQRLGLLLELSQNSLLIFLFIFQRDNFLNVIAAFELAAHRFDLFFIEGDLHLRLF